MIDTTDVLTDDARSFLTDLQRAFGARRRRAARAPGGAPRAPARRRAAGLPARDRRDPGRRLARRTDAGRDRRPARRDHRAGRPQDGDQRAQLGRAGVHGRLRGLELADLGQLHRRPAQPDGRARADDLARHRREAVHASTTTRRCCSCGRAAGTSRSATSRSTARRCPGRCSTSASTSSATTAATAATSTCRSSSRTSRRGSGTTSSPGRRSGSACEHGTIKATVLIETILAAFEMDEILYELRDHSAGLNAGRWDYIFSVIKKLGHRPEMVLPDRERRDDGGAVHALLLRAAREDLPPPRRVRDGRHGGLHPLAPRRRGERRSRSRRCARTRSARRRRASTAPGSPTPTSCRPPTRRSTPCSATGRTRSTGSATTSTSPPPTCSTSSRRPARRPRRACATTSRSGSSTSPPGSRAPAPSRSTT